MKKTFTMMALVAAVLCSCSKYEAGKTATDKLAGDWMCTVYYADEGAWVPDAPASYRTYNSAANVPSEIWLDDQESYWGTKVKLDASNSAMTFGERGKEYLDNYNGVAQLIWDGKVTEGAAVAPGSGTKCDKIEFFIAFSDDDPTAYASVYYVVGYRATGFPEDDSEPSSEWELPAVPEIPAITKPLE